MENTKKNRTAAASTPLKAQIETRLFKSYVSPGPCIAPVKRFQKLMISTIWIKEAKYLYLYRKYHNERSVEGHNRKSLMN